MASAEKLLHEAQYAFQCISFGQSRENSRNRSRASSLSKKIIRKYPGSMEAGEAHALLRRLGEEAYSSKIAAQHRHISQAEHHGPGRAQRKPADYVLRTPVPQTMGSSDQTVETLNWGGLLALALSLPKAILALVAFGGLFLFGLFGPFLFVPLVLFVLFTGPFRQMMKPRQREEMNAFIVRANDFIEQRRGRS
ncbi:MAG: hypothetical protein OER91_12160 [Gammaproteobacteria bacterium]|nr:hypothetical protein [Gammaproteobacteria bacterium]